MLQSCRVCGDVNGKNHYGSRACSGCKGFFRRTIKFKRIYRCQYAKSCTISPEYRNSCRACRFDKCLEAGLDPNMVHDDRGIANAKSFKEEMEAKTAKHRKIKPEITSEPQTPETSSSTDTVKTEPEVPESKALVKPHTSTFKKQCERWHDAMISINNRMYKACHGPMGSLRIIPEFNSSDGKSVTQYVVLVEKLCDEFFDSTANHIVSPISEYSHSTNVTASRALSDPREISVRTKIDWSGRFFITTATFRRMWCRVVGHYMDWTSHIPEIRQMTIADQVRLVIDRAVPCVDIMLGYRTMQHKIEGIALSGGTYFPRDKIVQELIDVELKPLLTAWVNWMFDEFTVPAKRMNLTEAEYALLRLLVFFVPVPGLSPQGKEIVRSASNFYREVLAQQIRIQFPDYSFDQILNRMGELMKFLSVIETAKTLEDEGFSVMTLFNIANMQGELPYEIHIRKGVST